MAAAGDGYSALARPVTVTLSKSLYGSRTIELGSIRASWREKQPGQPMDPALVEILMRIEREACSIFSEPLRQLPMRNLSTTLYSSFSPPSLLSRYAHITRPQWEDPETPHEIDLLTFPAGILSISRVTVSVNELLEGDLSRLYLLAGALVQIDLGLTGVAGHPPILNFSIWEAEPAARTPKKIRDELEVKLARITDRLRSAVKGYFSDLIRRESMEFTARGAQRCCSLQ